MRDGENRDEEKGHMDDTVVPRNAQKFLKWCSEKFPPASPEVGDEKTAVKSKDAASIPSAVVEEVADCHNDTNHSDVRPEVNLDTVAVDKEAEKDLNSALDHDKALEKGIYRKGETLLHLAVEVNTLLINIKGWYLFTRL
jgi:hypothetical protein